MKYNYPATIFVEQNTILGQIYHVLSEAEEVRNALEDLTQAPADKTDKDKLGAHLLEEIADLDHSLETLKRIIDKDQPGGSKATATFVINKNADRGYYKNATPLTPHS